MEACSRVHSCFLNAVNRMPPNNGADENGEDPPQAAVNHGKHQEATMRSGNVDAQQQGEHRGDGRGDHHDGHDGQMFLVMNGCGLGDVGAAKMMLTMPAS